jgi:hypothetical protein
MSLVFRKSLMLLGVALLASGCAMDLGGMWSDDTPQLSSQAPQPQPQQQVATSQYGQPAAPVQPQYGQPAQPQQYAQPVPPDGQAAFAPAPKPGEGSFTGSTVPLAPAGAKLGEEQLRSLLPGRTITVADGRTLEYGRSGSYQESRNGQVISVGQYQIRDVSVCVQFTTGLSRCDSFVDQNGQLFVEDRNGQRLPAQAG